MVAETWLDEMSSEITTWSVNDVVYCVGPGLPLTEQLSRTSCRRFAVEQSPQ